MTMLVNGIPTDEFTVKRGLRQGDPQSPYLFVIAAEGLARIVNHAVYEGPFREFKINDNVAYSLLPFFDDTIIVGNGSW